MVFQGPNAYISPTWMPGRKRHGKVAPSWNYAVVHAYGNAQIVADATWLKQHLRDLVTPQERHRSDGWSLDEAPEEFVAQLLNHIVGIEIKVERLIGKWFVGQQRSPSDREGVMTGLLQEQTEATSAIAAMMRAYAPVPK
jgi:transcriptional regulator